MLQALSWPASLESCRPGKLLPRQQAEEGSAPWWHWMLLSIAACSSWALQSKLWLWEEGGVKFGYFQSSWVPFKGWMVEQAAFWLISVLKHSLKQYSCYHPFASVFLGLGFHWSLLGHQSLCVWPKETELLWHLPPGLIPRAQTVHWLNLSYRFVCGLSVGVTCATGWADNGDGDSRHRKSLVCKMWHENKHAGPRLLMRVMNESTGERSIAAELGEHVTGN